MRWKMIWKILLGIVVVLILALGVIVFTFVKMVSAPHKFLKCEWNESVGKEYKDLLYENDYENTYDLYIPTTLDKSKTHGIILYIHGGGFVGGKKEDGALWCKFLTSRGYITATMDYTVHNDEHTSNINRMNSEIKACVSAIKKQCEELGISVDRLAVTGESAGGCLAMLYGYSSQQDAEIPVEFVFQLTGPAHFEPSGWGHTEAESAAGFVSLMSGKTITTEMILNGEAQQYIDEISPVAYVDENTPYTICGYGPKDGVVPVELKFKLFEKFEQCGVKYEYIEYPNSNHLMYSDLDKSQEYIEKVLEYLKKNF